jgi:hypothetical protein
VAQIVERVHPGYYAEHHLPNPLACVGGTDKKKWFQVIRFPALPTAVMHGTEHRV